MHVAKYEIKADGRRVGVADKPDQASDARKKYRNYGYKVEVKKFRV
jgi:hypothetical protein